MIERSRIQEIIAEQIGDSAVFVVDLQVKPGNLIQLFIDHPDGITIESCVQYSRLIESNLDREIEDFELQVSSPGLDQSFKVKEQYLKNLSKSIKVVTTTGQKLVGDLTQVDDQGIQLDAEVKVDNPEGKKKKTEIQAISLQFEDIKTAKVNLKF